MVAAVIAQHGGLAVKIVDDDIDMAVIEEITKSCAAADPRYHESLAGLCCHFRESPVAVVVEKQDPLRVLRPHIDVVHLWIDVAIYHHQVGPTVVVVVEKRSSPAHPWSPHLGNA